jgi:hypothetical protein
MFILLVWQILLPGFIGLANNGDFPKVAGPLSLGAADNYADSFLFFEPDYVRSSRYFWDPGLKSSEHLLATIAARAELTFGDPRIFDIRWLGVVHIAGWLLAYLVLLRAMRGLVGVGWWLAMFASLWIFADVSYVSYFNSFFMDTAGLIGGLAMAAAVPLLISERKIAIFGFASLLFVTSKSQHSLFALLPVILLIFIAATATRRISKATALAMMALVIAGSIWVATAAPDWYRNTSRFNLIFFKILPQSKTPAEDAKELGLAPSDVQFIGMHAFTPGGPASSLAWLLEFGHRGSYANVVRFYLKHPALALKFMWRDIVEEVWLIRANNLSNFPRSAGRPAGARTDRMASWSSLRSWLFVRWPPHIVTWYALALIGVTALLLRVELSNDERGIAIAVLFAALLGAGEFCFTTLVDALETYRHLLMFHLFTDLSIFFSLLLALTIYARPRALRLGGSILKS